MVKFTAGESLRVVLALSLLGAGVLAQQAPKTPTTKTARPATTGKAAPTRTAAPTEGKESAAAVAAEEAAEARRLLARTAIDQLDLILEDVKQIDNLSIGLPIARSLVAKLMRYKPERCRELLIYLYDKAERQVEATQDRLSDDTIKYGHHIHLRGIISIASSFDQALAQEFIERLAESKAFSQVLNKSEGTFSAAKEMLNANPQRAVTMASQATGEQFTVWTLDFLGQLRLKDPALARNFTFSLLQSMETRKFPTVKELFLLSPYILASKNVPFYDPTTGRLGLVYNTDYGKTFDKVQVDPELATRYLKLCVSLMMQPERYLEMYGPLRASEYDDLMFIDAVLLQAARTYLPAAVDSLVERRTVLLSSLNPTLRRSAGDAVTSYSTNRDTPIPTPDDLIQRAESAQGNPGRRNKLFFDAARAAASKKDYPKAMELIEKISETTQRTQAREFLSFDIARELLTAGKLDEARNWVREDSDPVRKGYLLTLIAASLTEGGNRNPQKVAELLSEAASLAAGLSPGAERFAMLSGIASIYARFDAPQALEALNRCAETVNGAEKIDGNLTVNRVLYLDQTHYAQKLYQSPLTITDAIGKLSRDHFAALLTIVRTLSNPVVRAKALLSTCEGVI
ncbi:MAG: hypothetical protein SF339_19880 [Blastocatellia bacterium]|nr:hypothetical protein [Blastocatellia bacterium]